MVTGFGRSSTKLANLPRAVRHTGRHLRLGENVSFTAATHDMRATEPRPRHQRPGVTEGLVAIKN